jgi:hypothetical protein
MWPLSIEMQQRLILQYLTPMGEYQEVRLCLYHIIQSHLCISLQMLSNVFEHNALELIFFYIDMKHNTDVRLAFEALRVKKSLFHSFQIYCFIFAFLNHSKFRFKYYFQIYCFIFAFLIIPNLGLNI